MTQQSSPPPEDLELKPYFWRFALLLSIMFLFFQITFRGPDYPIYPAFLDSIVVDGDMNVINNVTAIDPTQPCGETFRGQQVTKTHNYSDFHNTGSTVLWMPFYLYGQGLAILHNLLFSGSQAPEQADQILLCSLSYSNLIMGFLTCLMIFIITANFFPPRLAFWSTILIFWGTPAFFYTLIENGNANIPAMFMSVLLLLATPTGLADKNWRPAFLLGLLLAMCVAVKIDLWFQIFMIFATTIIFWFSGKLRPLNLLYIAAGYLLGGIPRLINDYIKFGDFHSGEAGMLNLQNSYHLQQLISPYQGFFTSSPILLICLVGLVIMIWLAIKKSDLQNFIHAPDQTIQRIIVAMSIWLGGKLFIIGFRFAWGGGTFGARQLLTELPYFVLLLSLINYQNQSQKNRWLRLILPTVLVITIFINFVQASEYLAREPMSYYLRDCSLLERIAHLRFLGLVLVRGLAQLPLKLTMIPPFLLTLWLTRALLCRSREINALFAPWRDSAKQSETEKPMSPIQRGLKGLTIYMLFTWFTISGANLINNHANVEAMTEQGCFDFVTVVPPNWFELDENVISMKEMIHYFKIKGDLKEVERIKSICKRIYPAEFYRLNN
jgi:hypothetical protein